MEIEERLDLEHCIHLREWQLFSSISPKVPFPFYLIGFWCQTRNREVPINFVNQLNPMYPKVFVLDAKLKSHASIQCFAMLMQKNTQAPTIAKLNQLMW